MFAARGIAVSLSVFVIVYCVVSLAVCLCWRAGQLHSRRYPVRRIADLLFAMRMFPLVTAAVITVAFTVPSFLLLEPRAIDEPMGYIPLVLGIGGAFLGIVGIANAGIALRSASHHARRACANSLADAAAGGENRRAALQGEALYRAAASALHRFGPCLQDENLTARTVLAPFDIHRARVMLLDDEPLARKSQDVRIA